MEVNFISSGCYGNGFHESFLKCVTGGQMSDEEWETDPDAINDVSEKQQRWGNKGTGKMVDLKAVQDEVKRADEEKAKAKSGFQRGYGGAHGHEASGDQTTAAAPGKKVWQPKSSFDERMLSQRSKEDSAGTGGAAAGAPAAPPPKPAPATPPPAKTASPPTPSPPLQTASPPAASPPATPPPKPPPAQLPPCARAVVPHGRTLRAHTARSHGKRRPTARRCGDTQLSSGSGREPELGL
jgi:hypothetical protein